MIKLVNNEEMNNIQNKIIIDVRSPGEYKDYHIEGAINIPIFDDAQRAEVGTMYKQISSNEAKKLGAKLIGASFADIVDEIVDLCTEYENVILYCHKGGMRSSSLAALLTSLNLDNIYKLDGGIKDHRNYVMNNLEEKIKTKKFVSLHGLTGVGKTKLLQLLEKKGFDVIDYEGIANNAGSVFGNILYLEPQPGQKQFEESLFYKIVNSKSDYIFVESESKRVGSVNIPDIYLEKLVEAYHVLVTATIPRRASVLIDDYHYDDNHQALIKCINMLRKRLSNEKADHLIELAKKDELPELVEILLVDYYDPLYNFSIDKYKPYDYTLEYIEQASSTDDLIEILRTIERKDNEK